MIALDEAALVRIVEGLKVEGAADADVLALVARVRGLQALVATATRFDLGRIQGRRAVLRKVDGGWLITPPIDDSNWYFDGKAWVRDFLSPLLFTSREAALAAVPAAESAS